MKKIKEILLYIWQLPQNILGLLLLLWYKIVDGKKLVHYTDYNGIQYWATPSMPSGISLGKYVIFFYQYHSYTDSFKHEYGHTKQSKKIGWFYLPIIGLPSLCGNILDRIFDLGYKFYYSQPWEAWADKEGGVKRKF